MDQSLPADIAELPLLLTLERPAAGAMLVSGGPLQGFGWVLAADKVRGLTIAVDGRMVGTATIGLLRPDVAEVHRHYPANRHAGFAFAVILPPLPPGQCDLALTVQTAAGRVTRHFPIAIAPPSVSQDAAAAPEPPRIALDEARIDDTGTLHVGGRVIGTRTIGAVELRVGERAIGFADTEAMPDAPSSADDGSAHETRFAFRAPTDPAGACEPLTAVIHASAAAGFSVDPAAAVRDTRSILLPPAPGTELPVMVARIDEAAVNDRGILRVSGWAVCLAAITDITVWLADEALGAAQHFMPRPDVGADYPDYPGAADSGFLLHKALSDEQLAADTLKVIVRATGGIRRELVIPIARAAIIRRAARAETIGHFIDIASLTEAGALSLKGWAVCPSGVASITVEVAGQVLGEAELGGHRPDIGNLFPDIASAPFSGFRFATTAAPACQGEQVVRLVVRGREGEERTILQPVLAVEVDDGTPPAAPAPDFDVTRDAGHIKFFLDLPAVENGRALAPVRGFLSLKGWAFARTGAVRIEVFVDGVSQGEAYRGVRREDLQEAFPDWDALLAGFAMLIPPQVMKPGPHEVRLVVRDTHGHAEEMGFAIDAEAAAEGPGPWQLRRKLPQSETDLQLAILAAANVRPVWCLVLPLRRLLPADLAGARDTIASLRHQAYPHWSLTIAVPVGTDTVGLAAILLADVDDLAANVIISPLPADRRLADLAAGPHGGADFFALLSPGDRLGEDALLELSLEAAGSPRSDFFYSDERRIDPADGAVKAFFKPDWSPDLLLSTNYIGRLWAARRGLLTRVGLRLGDLERAGDYEAVLLLCERAAGIAHVPKVLCERGDIQRDSPGKERAALQRAARRLDIKARILPGCLPGTWRFQRDIAAMGLVSIIIPSIASRGLIEITIRSIRAHTAWPAYEIIVLDNIRGTADPEQLGWKRWMAAHADRVIEIDEPFNWSRFNNLGAARARGEYLLFLNDDIEVLDADWLHGLVEHAQRPEIGVVGPQLLYPDGRVQHAGVFLSHAAGRHAFRFYPKDAPGPFGLALTQRNVISVTGACMMVRRAVFEEVGGFDEAHALINNDLDFALRLQQRGRLVVYTPHVSLVHHEMVSRVSLKDVYDAAVFDASWKDLFLRGDPYFHPTLSSDYDDYMAEPEPLRQFQVGHPLIARDRVRRILAVKVDHIGDFIAAFPAFRRIKQHFPNAELCVLAARASLSLAPLEPAIDRVIEFNFFHARSELGQLSALTDELAALEKTLAPMRFDIALDLRRQPDTRQILPYTGARWLAGFDQDHALPWLDIAVEFEGDVARTFKRSHVSDSLLHLVDAVRIACDSDRAMVRAPASAADARMAILALPAVATIAGALYARPLVCVHTGAGAANKQWPAASFGDLIDLLAGRDGVNILIIGGPDEADFAAEVMKTVRRPQHVFCLVGAVDLRDLPTLLLTCALYVGNDSGPKHLAAALGVPTIGIHSGSVDAGEWGPMGPATLTIRREMICGPCYIAFASDCPRGLACLYGIKVGEVHNACSRLLMLRKKSMMPSEICDTAMIGEMIS